MFSTKRRQSIESITESKNASAWESLILDLSETRREDDEKMADVDSDGGGGFLNFADVDASLSLSGSANNEEKMEQKLESLPESLNAAAASSNDEEVSGRQGFPDPPSLNRKISQNNNTMSSLSSADASSSQSTPTALESPSQLQDWMAYHTTKHPPHVNYMGRKMDETYTFKAAKIALSLSKYLGRQFEQEKDAKNSHEDLPSISCEDIQSCVVLCRSYHGLGTNGRSTERVSA